jgi:hypothetical protein
MRKQQSRANLEMLRTFILGAALLFFCISFGNFSVYPKSQKTKERYETPREKFYRQGGKTIKATVSVREDGELTVNTIAENRDLNLYDQAGHFDCRYYTLERFADNQKQQFIEMALAQPREFIWEHWQQKRRGYIRITFDSVDAVSTSHIFIEPDANGVWKVTWRIVRHMGEVDDKPPIFSVERSLQSTYPSKKGALYKLIFKYKDGDTSDL